MKCISPNWPAPANIKAFTTTRQSIGDIDLKHPKERQSLTRLFALPEEPIWINQVHSAIAIEALPENQDKTADALFTNKPNHLCAVLTADCLPILICNRQGTHIAAIHAGWRGLANGIVEQTLEQLPIAGQDLLVWLGPAIGPGKFEVGSDVLEAFTHHDPEASRAFAPQPGAKWLADLYQLARLRLHKYGINEIYGGNFCTHSQSDLFFSYRRDQGKTGRMASIIWVSPPP